MAVRAECKSFLVAVSGGENASLSVNRSLDTVGVTGSNPVSRTAVKPLKQSGLHSREVRFLALLKVIKTAAAPHSDKGSGRADGP